MQGWKMTCWCGPVLSGSSFWLVLVLKLVLGYPDSRFWIVKKDSRTRTNLRTKTRTRTGPQLEPSLYHVDVMTKSIHLPMAAIHLGCLRATYWNCKQKGCEVLLCHCMHRARKYSLTWRSMEVPVVTKNRPSKRPRNGRMSDSTCVR